MDRVSSTRPSASSLFLRQGMMEFLVCAIAGLVYLGTLAFGFVYDDVPQILKNPAIQNWHSLPQYFTSHVWAAIYPNSSGNYYRPIFLLWLRLNYALFGANPAGWHATSVLCHLVATWLVFRLARQLTGEQVVAFVAALLFGLHPAHVENVAWISGITDPLMTCFVLGSCVAFLSFRASRKLVLLALSLALVALALLSKETALVAPLLIFMLSFIDEQHPVYRKGDEHSEVEEENPEFRGDRIAAKLARAARDSASYLFVAMVYIGARCLALRGFMHPTIPISWAEVFLTWPSILWFYAQHLFLPFHLSEFYPVTYVSHVSTGAVLLPLSLLLAFGTAVCFLIRAVPQKQVAYFALALIMLPVLPVLDLRSLTAGDIVHDRYLYLPSAGFALLIALLIADLERHLREQRRTIARAALALLFTGAVSLVFATSTLKEQEQWANDLRLYTRGVQSAPDNLTARDDLANALLAANQPQRAVQLYLDVLQRNPNFWRSNYNLGLAYYKSGNVAAAEKFLRQAIRIDGSDPDQYIYLAAVQLQRKEFSEAAENARQAIARNPVARGYHFMLGTIFEAENDLNGAIAAFRTETELHPDNTAAATEGQKIEKMASLHH